VHELERDLEEYNILYERPIAMPHGVSKAEIIEKENVEFYFDDQTSNLQDVRHNIACFHVFSADHRRP
jgi:hypothetical protein